MPTQLDVIAIVGSLRKDSFTRKFTRAITSLAPDSMKIEIVEIGNLPLYSQDQDDNAPAVVEAFRARIKRANAVLFATPEYNRSVPGVLKNAVDIGSRPGGKNAWAGKPAAIVSVTPYNMGGFGANHHLRQALMYLDMPTMQQPEAYVSNVEKLLDASGKVANEDTKQLFTKFLKSFEDWIKRTAPPS